MEAILKGTQQVTVSYSYESVMQVPELWTKKPEISWLRKFLSSLYFYVDEWLEQFASSCFFWFENFLLEVYISCDNPINTNRPFSVISGIVFSKK